MSTVLDSVLEGAAALISAPGRALAARAYREAVFSGEVSENILTAARRIRSEWDQDRAVYVGRVESRRILLEDVPKLTAAAEKAAADLAGLESFARGVIPDELTVDQLRERIRQVTPKAHVGTPAELAAALAQLASQMVHSPLGRLKARAFAAKHAATDAKTRAERFLIETSATVPGDNSAAALQNEIRGHEQQIAQCDKVLQVAGQVPGLMELITKAARHEVSPGSIGMNTRGSSGEVVNDREIYDELRNRLDRAQQIAQEAPAAEAKRAKHLAAIADLKAKLPAAHDEWFRRISEPRNMKFFLGDD